MGRLTKHLVVTTFTSLYLFCSQIPEEQVIFRGDTPLKFSVTQIEVTENQIRPITLQLLKKPSSNVTIPLIATDNSEISLSVPELIFTPENYSTPQTINVLAQDDCLQDGTQELVIKTNGITSNDSNYKVSDIDIPVTVLDSADNLPNIVFLSSGALTTSEMGTSDFFQVKLSCQPVVDIQVPLVVSDTAEIDIDKTTLVFTPTNYNIEQTVNVIGKSDCVIDTDKPFTVKSNNVTPLATIDGVATALTDDRFNRYHSTATIPSGTVRKVAVVNGTNYNYTLQNDLIVYQMNGALDMTLNFAGTHPDPYITLGASMTCPVATQVSFSINFSQIAGSGFATIVSPQSQIITFNSTNWNQTQYILMAWNTAITADPFGGPGVFTTSWIETFESTSTVGSISPIANSIYAPQKITIQITVQ